MKWNEYVKEASWVCNWSLEYIRKMRRLFLYRTVEDVRKLRLNLRTPRI